MHLVDSGYHAEWFYEHGRSSPIWGQDERFRIIQSGIGDLSIVHSLVVSRWQKFASKLKTEDTIAVLESSLLHTTVNVMLAMDFQKSAILSCLQEVEQIMKGLNSVSIYLYPNNIRHALRAISDVRPYSQFEGPLVELFTTTRYAKTHGLSGFDGVVEFFENCREIIDAAFIRLKLSKLAINFSSLDWNSYERQITNLLGLPPMLPIPDCVDSPSRFVGCYKGPDSDAELVVAYDEKGLYLDDERHTRLIQRAGSTYYVNAHRLELSFEDERGGVFARVRLKGDLPVDNSIWVRT
jgi:hypothetical protein